MSRKAIKSINWTAFGELLSESDKPALVAFKSKSDQYLRRMQANSETPQKLDWAYYKQHIPLPGLVEKFQKEYESVSIPYPADKYSADIDARAEQQQSAIKQFIDASNKEIENRKKEIARMEAMIPYDQMTMEDFRDAHPELALDAINNPTVWPHTPEFQPDPKDGSTKEHAH